MRIPAGAINYSISMYYAVVFQDPSHSAAQQPRFQFSATDSATSKPIGCGTYTFIASSSLPGFTKSSKGSNVYYKSWSTMSINLSGYAGKTVILDFASGDCSQGGHFGYGYFDLGCSTFQINGAVCPGGNAITLRAPDGFSSYTWYDSALKNYIGSGQSITIANPKAKTKYKVIITPYSGYGCKDTLQTQVDNSKLKIESITPDSIICYGKKLQLKATPSDESKFAPLTGEWRTKKGNLICSNCDQYNIYPTSSDTFIYRVKNSPGCRDSAMVKVGVIPPLKFTQNISDVRICEKQLIKLKIGSNLTQGVSINWYKDTAEIKSNFNIDSLVFAKANYSHTGYYRVRIANRCDTIWSNKIYILVDTLVQLNLTNAGKILCENEHLKLKQNTVGTGPLYFSWKKDGKYLTETGDSLIHKNVVYYDSGIYTAIVKGRCNADSAKVKIIVNPHIRAGFGINQTPQCFNEQQFVFADKSWLRWGSYTANWDLGNGIKSNQKQVNYDSFKPGTYTVKMWVKTAAGCTDSMDKTVVIYPSPETVISANEMQSCFKEQKFSFTDNSTIAYSSMIREWYFDTKYVGNTKIVSPSTAFTDGDHLIYLRNVSQYGCVDSQRISVTVYPSPVVKIITSDTDNCFAESVFYKDDTKINSGTFKTYWRSNNLTANDTAIFQPVFPVDAVYWVWNKAVSDMGCTDSAQVKVNIHPNPLASIAINDSIQCFKEQQFIFTDASKIGNKTQLKRSWFLDGNTLADTVKNLKQMGLLPGKHLIKLLTTSINQCRDSSEQGFAIYHSPVAKIQTSDTDNCYLQPIAFTDLSTLAAGNFNQYWRTANIVASNTHIFKPVYANDGIFDLWNKAVSDSGCTDSIKIRIVIHPNPTVNFSINSDAQCEKEQAFHFTDLSKISSADKLYRRWTLDGINLADTAKNKWINGLKPGVHSLKLYNISVHNCRDSITRNIEVFPSPIARRKAMPLAYCENAQAFRFVDSSALLYGTYSTLWRFSDNTSASGGNVVKTYASAANYTNRQVVTSDKGCTDSNAFTTFVYPKPNAVFSINDAGQCEAGQNFDFNDQSSIAYTQMSRKWKLDGNTLPQSTANLQLRGLKPGTHIIKVWINSEFNCADSMAKSVKVFPEPILGYKITRNEFCIDNQNFIFTDNTTLSTGKFGVRWYFGDGGFAGQKSISHTYAQVGKFAVKQLVTTDSNCTDSQYFNVLVRPNPVAQFTVEDTLYELPKFNNLSIAASTYTWDFGNGRSRIVHDKSPINDVAFDFHASRKYFVTLTVNDTFGCFDSASAYVRYLEPFIHIPNAIVTNEDGVNKVFGISCFRCKGYSLLIYNNWGQVIYRSAPNNLFPKWDGTFNGELVAAGVYAYAIEVTDFSGHKHIRNGSVTVIK